MLPRVADLAVENEAVDETFDVELANNELLSILVIAEKGQEADDGK
jgi:hypothetical protein